MSATPLLLLAPRVTDDSVVMWQAALQAGWRCQRLANWRVPPEIRQHGGEFCLYAEPLFAEAIASELDLVLLEPPVDWLPALPVELVHREVRRMLLSQATSLAFPHFVKPAEGKTFEPRVYASADDLPRVEQIGDLAVLTSTPVDFELEVRCFVRGGRVVSASPYWREHALAQAADGSWPFLATEEEEAVAFADAVLAHPLVERPPAFVLDVGRIAGLGWAVVEGNPCWGAGLYGCDPREVLETARVAVLRAESLTPATRRWMQRRANASK